MWLQQTERDTHTGGLFDPILCGDILYTCPAFCWSLTTNGLFLFLLFPPPTLDQGIIRNN